MNKHKNPLRRAVLASLAFLVNMGFSAVPTPLYALYQRRDHFSTFMVTVVYAVYAIGVIASLFLGGHISDWVGRKNVVFFYDSVVIEGSFNRKNNFRHFERLF